MMEGQCALCNKHTELKLSHIIPKFVFNWFKESAPSAIRNAIEPNKRIQDGEKQYLLCPQCEEIFSSWEKVFCERIFLPLHSDPLPTAPIKYGAWALKFAVSVSWRVLTYFHQIDDLHHLSNKQMETAIAALDVWRRFLLGELPHPAQFEQHLVPLEVIQSYSGKAISPFLNRYLLRSVHMSVFCTNTQAVVYTKMGHLILFGFILEDTFKRWKGTKLHVNNGLIMPRTYYLPKYVSSILNEEANKMAKALTSVSPRQNHIIQDAFLQNADKLADSELFKAMQYDVYHSGEKAFKITESTEDKDSEV